MKKLIFFMLFMLLIILTFNINAQSFPDYYDKYVDDFAHIFNNDQVNELRNTLIEVDRNTTAEVVVVTINSTEPLTPSQYRTELFNKWKIGKADNDNGLLILYSLKENRIEIETGYGLEGILPDSKLGRMLDEDYVPYRDKNEVAQGIILFTKDVAKVIQDNKEEVLSPNKDYSYKTNVLFFLFPFAFLIIFIITIYKIINTGGRKCKKDRLHMKYIGLVAGYYVYKCAKGHTEKMEKSFFNNHLGGRYNSGFGGGGFSGGGFSGGGFGGFGGGGSGGGGVGR